MLKWGRSLKAVALGSLNIFFFMLPFCKDRALIAPQDVLLLHEVTAGSDKYAFVDLSC